MFSAFRYIWESSLSCKGLSCWKRGKWDMVTMMVSFLHPWEVMEFKGCNANHAMLSEEGYKGVFQSRVVTFHSPALGAIWSTCKTICVNVYEYVFGSGKGSKRRKKTQISTWVSIDKERRRGLCPFVYYLSSIFLSPASPLPCVSFFIELSIVPFLELCDPSICPYHFSSSWRIQTHSYHHLATIFQLKGNS